MIARHAMPSLVSLAERFPSVTLTGPRQSGKTTLAQAAFPQHQYLSLESPAVAQFAIEDPIGFLRQLRERVILDEIQRVPDLFRYIQVMIDEDPRPGRFVLTGSQNFLLMRSISESLAGRSAILHLLPFSLSELYRRPALDWEDLNSPSTDRPRPATDLPTTLFTGFYPRIHNERLPADQWLGSYIQTYIERDVRLLENVGDLHAFASFVRLCAGRAGQLLNFSSLASDAGISHTTARRWFSLLQTSFIVTSLQPHYRNFSKRLVKTPKLYFLDTGLLCHLLRIRNPADLQDHPLRGAIFENFVVAEALKNQMNRGLEPNLSFWRDNTGHEIDLLLEFGPNLLPVEAKSGATLASDSADALRYWMRLASHTGFAAIVYGGDETYTRSGITCLSWSML
jgi:predicted AAA+ superfamily ATPase